MVFFIPGDRKSCELLLKRSEGPQAREEESARSKEMCTCVQRSVYGCQNQQPRCQNAIYLWWHTRQAVAVTPTVHQQRHEPKPPFDHTCSTAPQLRDCSITSHTFHWIIVYCCFTHFAYTINYGCWELNNLQAAGFIFLAKLHVNNSVHQLLHLDVFFIFFPTTVFVQCLQLAHAANNSCLHTPSHQHCRTGLMRKGQSSLTCQWWQGLMGSRSCCHNSFYHSIDCGEVRKNTCWSQICEQESTTEAHWDRGSQRSITGKKRRIMRAWDFWFGFLLGLNR